MPIAAALLVLAAAAADDLPVPAPAPAAPSAPAPAPAPTMKHHPGPFAKVMEEAKASGRMVMIDYYAEWCGPCKWMKAHVFTDAGVAAYSNDNFLFYAVDAEKGEGPELAKKHGVEGYPTFVFLSPEGERLESAVGGRPVAGFLALMKEMKAGNHMAGLRARVAKDDKDGQAHALLGEKLARARDVDGARPHLERAIALDPETRAAHTLAARFWSATIRMQEEMSPEPLAAFAEKFPEAPQAVEAHRWLASIHEQMGDSGKALASLEFVLRRAPDADARNGVAWALALLGKDLERALKLVDQAIEERPKTAAYLDTRAECLSRLGRHAEAVAAQKEAVGLCDPREKAQYEERLRAFEAKQNK